LDIVRRDWCDLSKEMGNYILDQLLSGSSREEVCDAVFAYLRKTAADIAENKIPLSKYIITKMLTKDPSDYPDAKSQPHVKVALKLRAQGRMVRPGDSIQYVICIGAEQSYADRAYPPEAVKSGAGVLRIDVPWYLSQQLHPPITRICELIEGMDAARIAEALGLDPAKFRRHVQKASNNAEPELFQPVSRVNEEERFKAVEKLILTCPSCSKSTTYDGVSDKTLAQPPLSCSSCKSLFGESLVRNHVTLLVRNCCKQYYEGWLQCTDRACDIRQRQLWVRSNRRATCVMCEQDMMPVYSEKDLYTQLDYLCWLFDPQRLQEDADGKKIERPSKLLDEHLRRYQAIHKHCMALFSSNDYNFIDLSIFQLRFVAAPGSIPAGASPIKKMN